MMRARTAAIWASAVILSWVMSPVTRAAQGAWEFHLTPYLWGAGIEGTVGLGGQTTDINASVGDLFEFLDIGGSLHFEAHKDAWGWFGDAFYVKLEDEVTGPLGGTIFAEVEQSVAEAGAAYRFADKLELLMGLRYQKVDDDFTFPTPIGLVSAGRNWVDGFAGVRWTPVLTDKWILWLRGDVGAGESDLVWMAALGGGYRFNKTVALVGGYRMLDTDFEDGGFVWDVTLSGVAVGVDFAW